MARSRPTCIRSSPRRLERTRIAAARIVVSGCRPTRLEWRKPCGRRPPQRQRIRLPGAASPRHRLRASQGRGGASGPDAGRKAGNPRLLGLRCIGDRLLPRATRSGRTEDAGQHRRHPGSLMRARWRPTQPAGWKAAASLFYGARAGRLKVRVEIRLPGRCTPAAERQSETIPSMRQSALRQERPLPANGCTRARSLSDSLISRNSRSARSASASSKGRSCRHCSDRRKSRAGRNSASRHRTRNNLGLDRYTRDAGCGAPCAKPQLSACKLEGCYSVAVDSPAGSRSRASVAPAVYAPAQPARRPAAATGRWQSTETRGAT